MCTVYESYIGERRCPLCSDTTLRDPRPFNEHVGCHMDDTALLALSKGLYQYEDDEVIEPPTALPSEREELYEHSIGRPSKLSYTVVRVFA